MLWARRGALAGLSLLLICAAGCAGDAGDAEQAPAAGEARAGEAGTGAGAAGRQPALRQPETGFAAVLSRHVAEAGKKPPPPLERIKPGNFSEFSQILSPVFRMAERRGKGEELLRDLEGGCSGDERVYLRLWRFRRGRDEERYVREAEAFLKGRRDDGLAADVMRIHAGRKDEAAFSAFGEAYAQGRPRLLLAYSEIARNAAWKPMMAAFAERALAEEGLPFVPAFRCASFLMEAGRFGEAEKTLARLEKTAEKRYQREDLALLRFRLAEKAGALAAGDAAALRDLAENGMMPQVRREAGRILSLLDKPGGGGVK